jgi:hypothetical protein
MTRASDRRPTGRASVASLGLLLLLAPAVARADNPPAVEKLIQMNKAALEQYDTLEWDAAKRTLLQALVFAKKSGLETHQMMARTYIHLGAVYIVGFKDKQKGVQSFARAIEIDPSIRISKAMSAPELEQIFAEAGKGRPSVRAVGSDSDDAAAAAPPPPPAPSGRRRRNPIMEDDASSSTSSSSSSSSSTSARPRGRPRDDDSGGEPDLPAHINALDCPTKDETPPDKPVAIRCAVASNLSRVVELILFYLEPGKDDFSEVPMEKTPKGWYAAKIPKKAVSGTSLRFYIEGRDAKGKPVVSNGAKDNPNLMLIRELEAAETEKELSGGTKSKAEEEEENPLDERDPNRPHRFLGKIDRSKIGLDTRYGNRGWWIGLGIGTGYGFAKGNGFEVRTDLNSIYKAGLAWAGFFHLAPEIGYQINPDFALSLEGRNQYIPQNAHFSRYAATGANSVLLRFLAYTRQRQWRFYSSVAAGGGEGFRLIINHDTTPPGDPSPGLHDTVRGGPGLIGVGGGFLYEITKGVSYMIEVNVLAGLPIFSVVADLNTGFQVNFGTSAPAPKPQVEPTRHTKTPDAQQQDDE